MKVQVQCAQCDKDVFRNKSDIANVDNSFCNNSCAAKFNNKKYPKRQPEGKCDRCGCPNNKSRANCKPCRKTVRIFIQLRKEVRIAKNKTIKKVRYESKRAIYIKWEKALSSVTKPLTVNVLVNNKDMTIKDAFLGQTYQSNAYSLVRSRGRSVAKKLGWNSCAHCGYDKHIQICHIKAISSFDEDTLISVVNSKDNLIALCPNCHWEFDHK